jgi:hypothetical protein
MLKRYFRHPASLTLTWWQWKLYKLTHVVFGVILGVRLAELLRPWTAALWVLVAVLFLSLLPVTWRRLENRTP